MPAGPAAAQSGGVVLRGTVAGLGGTPIAEALIYVDTSATAQLSDSAGDFRVAGLPPGGHVLHVRKLGFAPRRLQFALESGDTGVIDVGLIGLSSGPAPILRVHGQVRDVVEG
ncbi:MAG TPA: carboxypeptidase-like regulatory domain-containing protein [Gemmatimonadales bacterium]